MRKIISILLILVLCISCIGLTGCTKTSRTAVIASVGDEKVTIGDVTDLFWNYGYYYVYYYGYSVESVVSAHISELIADKACLVLAKESLEVLSPSQKGNLKYLSAEEINKIEYQVAVAVYDNILSYAQALAKEDEVTIIEKTSRTEAPDDAKWTIKEVFDPEKGPFEEDNYLAKYWSKAIKQLKTILKSSNRTIKSWKQDMTNSYANNMLILKYREELYQNEIVPQYTEDYIKQAFADQLNSEKDSYLTKETYFTALSKLDDCDMIIYNPYEGYGFVRQILVPFTDAQLEDLKAQKEALSDEEYTQYREELAKAIVAEEQRTALNYIGDFTAKEDLNLYSDSFYGPFFNSLVNAMGGYDSENKTFNGLTERQVEAFEEYLWAYNTDSGALSNSRGYAINPDGDSSYVTEFITIARELLTRGVGAIDYCITEYGVHYLLVTELVEKYDETRDVINWSERNIEGSFTNKFIETLEETVGSYALENNISNKVAELDQAGKINRKKDGQANAVAAVYNQANG